MNKKSTITRVVHVPTMFQVSTSKHKVNWRRQALESLQRKLFKQMKTVVKYFNAKGRKFHFGCQHGIF